MQLSDYRQTDERPDLEEKKSPGMLEWLCWWIGATYAGLVFGLFCYGIGIHFGTAFMNRADTVVYQLISSLNKDIFYFVDPPFSPFEEIFRQILPAVQFGVCLGAAQAYVLRGLMSRTASWVLALTVSCGAIAAFTSGLPEFILQVLRERWIPMWVVQKLVEVQKILHFQSVADFLQTILGIFLLLLIIGLPQWIVLRLEVPKAGWWVPISLLAIFLSLLVFQTESGFIGVCLSVLVFGLSTGIGLLWMFRGYELRKI